jgi:hypothetical protein
MRMPHKKNIIMPGYGCLRPTFKLESTIRKYATRKISIRPEDETFSWVRLEKISLIVLNIKNSSGITATRPNW